jgi:hypothetical protein
MNRCFIYGWILIAGNAGGLIASIIERNPVFTTLLLLGSLAACEAQRLRYRRLGAKNDLS